MRSGKNMLFKMEADGSIYEIMYLFFPNMEHMQNSSQRTSKGKEEEEEDEQTRTREDLVIGRQTTISNYGRSNNPLDTEQLRQRNKYSKIQTSNEQNLATTNNSGKQ